MNRSGFWSDVSKYRTLLLMLLPAVLFFILFAYIPMAGIVLAFKQFNYAGGIFGSAWNGLDNFRFFFDSGDAWRVTRNTALYNIAFIIVNNVLQIVAAILLFEAASPWFRKIFQTMLFLPYFISWVVVGAIAYNLFNYDYGTLNVLLESLGMQPLDIYNTAAYWPVLLVIISAWKAIGYGSIIYLAAITGIDREMYEAAEIDGATFFSEFYTSPFPICIPPSLFSCCLQSATFSEGTSACSTTLSAATEFCSPPPMLLTPMYSAP